MQKNLSEHASLQPIKTILNLYSCKFKLKLDVLRNIQIYAKIILNLALKKSKFISLY